jgi:hypothetical protein
MSAAARRGSPSLDAFDVHQGNGLIALVNSVTNELAALRFLDSGTDFVKLFFVVTKFEN